MARWPRLLSAALAAWAISSVATVQADEGDESGTPVSIDEIPAPAHDAIMRQVGAGTLMEVVETSQGGERVYLGRITDGTRMVRVWVDAAGNILNIRRVL